MCYATSATARVEYNCSSSSRRLKRDDLALEPLERASSRPTWTLAHFFPRARSAAARRRLVPRPAAHRTGRSHRAAPVRVRSVSDLRRADGRYSIVCCGSEDAPSLITRLPEHAHAVCWPGLGVRDSLPWSPSRYFARAGYGRVHLCSSCEGSQGPVTSLHA